VLASVEQGEEVLRWKGRPLTAGVLRGEISLALAGFGLSQPRQNIVAAGADAAVPHSQCADDRTIRANETIVIDLFPKGELFADCTRTFCVGEPSPDVGSAFGLVRQALKKAYAEAHIGMRLWELQEKTCGFFADGGYPTPISAPGTTRGYVHGLGHGVGFEIHEYPSFAQGASEEGVLEPGDVFALEPGLYDQAAGYGIRLEDLCLATDAGIENLTPLPYDLDPRSW
jgi:Xaa-Pro aminopeptidase